MCILCVGRNQSPAAAAGPPRPRNEGPPRAAAVAAPPEGGNPSPPRCRVRRRASRARLTPACGNTNVPAMARDPLAVIYFAKEEVRSEVAYWFDNARRRDANSLVIQRTMSGAGFFSDSAGRRLVPAETAM